MGRRERTAYRRQIVGFVWQQTARNLLPYLTARRERRAADDPRRRRRRERQRARVELLETGRPRRPADHRPGPALRRRAAARRDRRGPRQRARRCCSPTSRPASSTARTAPRSSSCSGGSTASSARPIVIVTHDAARVASRSAAPWRSATAGPARRRVRRTELDETASTASSPRSSRSSTRPAGCSCRAHVEALGLRDRVRLRARGRPRRDLAGCARPAGRDGDGDRPRSARPVTDGAMVEAMACAATYPSAATIVHALRGRRPGRRRAASCSRVRGRSGQRQDDAAQPARRPGPADAGQRLLDGADVVRAERGRAGRRAARRGSASSSRRSGCCPSCPRPRTSRCRCAWSGPTRASASARVAELLDLVGLAERAQPSARTSCRAASSSGSPSPAPWPTGRAAAGRRADRPARLRDRPRGSCCCSGACARPRASPRSWPPTTRRMLDVADRVDRVARRRILSTHREADAAYHRRAVSPTAEASITTALAHPSCTPRSESHDDRPLHDRRLPAPFALGDGRPPSRPPSTERETRTGRPGCSTATRRLWSTDRARREAPSPSASAGSTRRRISRTGSPGSKGSATASSTAGFTTAIVAGMGGSSLAPDVLHRTFGSQDGYLALRILDSTDPAYVSATLDDLDPLKTLIDRRLASRARRPSRTRSSPTPGTRAEEAMDAVSHHTYDNPGAFFAADHGPGQERRRDRPPRRLPRGLPQPAGHRRALLGADLRRARAGLADRAGPRRAPRLGARRCSAPAASRTRRPTRASRSASPSARSARPAATS